MSSKWKYLLVLQSTHNDSGMYMELLGIIPNRISRKVSLPDYFVFLCLRQQGTGRERICLFFLLLLFVRIFYVFKEYVFFAMQ